MEHPRSGKNPEASIDIMANAKFEYQLSPVCIAGRGGKVGITLSDFFSWTLPRCAYGFLMNFSGLPEQSVAMLSFWLREKVRFIESSGWGRATELYVFGSMTVIVLVTICLVACGFLLYVLFQWTRETKRRPTSRSAIGDEPCQAGQKKQPYIVGSRRAAERHDRTTSFLQAPSI